MAQRCWRERMTTRAASATSRDDNKRDLELMKRHHIRHLVVVDEGRVVGMVSLRDLFNEIIDEQAETIDQLEHYIRGQ